MYHTSFYIFSAIGTPMIPAQAAVLQPFVLALTRLSGEAPRFGRSANAPSVCVVEGGLKCGNTGGI